MGGKRRGKKADYEMDEEDLEEAADKQQGTFLGWVGRYSLSLQILLLRVAGERADVAVLLQ